MWQQLILFLIVSSVLLHAEKKGDIDIYTPQHCPIIPTKNPKMPKLGSETWYVQLDMAGNCEPQNFQDSYPPFDETHLLSNIIELDYSKYAAIFMCDQVADTSFIRAAMILTRDSQPVEATLNKSFEIFRRHEIPRDIFVQCINVEEVCFDPKKIKKHWTGKCVELKNGTKTCGKANSSKIRSLLPYARTKPRKAKLHKNSKKISKRTRFDQQLM